MRQDRVFFWIIAVYFAAHTVLRTALGGAFEVDEAEMFVLAQDYRLGYGPQAPLYNWLQATAFHIFGANTFAVSVTKNLLLFATYTLFFDGLRRLIPSRLAIFGTLALLLLPNLSWEGQRAGSHTIAMLAVMAATFNVMARRIEAPEQRWHAVALGITLGLGGIAKYNFWLFPLTLLLSAATLPQLRQALIRRDLWLSVLIAIPILTLPVGWMILHPDQTLASTYKFHKPPEYASQPLWVAGTAEYIIQTLAALALLLLTIFVARLSQGRSALHIGPIDIVAAWLIRAGGIGLSFGAVAVIAFSVSDVQPRWLLPVLIPLSIGLMIWPTQTLSERTKRNLLRFCAFLAVLILVAMADTRLRGAGSDSMRIDLLAEDISTHLPQGQIAVISGGYYFTGNLKYHRPAWQALASLPNQNPAPETSAIVLVGENMVQNPEPILARMNISPENISDIERYSVTLPYRFEAVKTIDVPYAIVRIKNGAQ